MARKKHGLSFIMNDAKRKATYKKRKNGLFKKAFEITTLCDVEACAVIYTPDKPVPDVWPSHPEAFRVIHKLKTLPEFEQSKQMMNQESLQTKRLMKAQEQLKKMQFENRKKEMDNLMIKCICCENIVVSNVNNDVCDMKWMIGQRMIEIDQKDAREKLQHRLHLGANNNNNGAEENAVAVAPVMGHSQGLMLSTNVNDAAAAMPSQDWAMVPYSANDADAAAGNQMFSFGNNFDLPYGYLDGPSP